MPHFRPRHIQRLLEKGLRFTPLLALLGHRQVGKTTLSTHIATSYYSLDLRATRDIIETDPQGFLKNITKFPTVLDEAQYIPDLFPALKEHVRQNPKPGQFVLTGSVRLSSRKKIIESLTGRIIYYELLPMDLSEIHLKKLPNTLEMLLRTMKLPPKKKTEQNSFALIEQYVSKGGLPGLFYIRDTSLFEQKIATQLETILERDLRFFLETSLSFQSLKTCLAYFALHQGDPFEWSTASRMTRVSRPTLIKLANVFESLFLLRRIAVEGSEKKPTYMLEDQGEATYLIGERRDPLFDVTRFLYANLRCQIHYRPELKGEIFQYRSRANAYVPLCFRIKNKEIGIIPILEDYPSQQAIKSSQSFLKFYPKGITIFATAKKSSLELSPRSFLIPVPDLVL